MPIHSTNTGNIVFLSKILSCFCVVYSVDVLYLLYIISCDLKKQSLDFKMNKIMNPKCTCSIKRYSKLKQMPSGATLFTVRVNIGWSVHSIRSVFLICQFRFGGGDIREPAIALNYIIHFWYADLVSCDMG